MKVALLSYDFAEYCIQQANGLAGECEVLLMLPEDSAPNTNRSWIRRCAFGPSRSRD